jgi:hypothetical protein
MLLPAGIVNGKEAPFSTNLELLLASAVTVTLAFAALIVMGWVSVVPTVTSPKLTVAGVIVSCPTLVVVPVPFRGTFREGPVTYALPPLIPAVFGAKVRFRVTLFPPFKVNGNAGPLAENSLPVICQAVIFTLQERVLLRTTGTVVDDPTATWPNETLAGLATRLSLVVPPPPSSN